MSPKRDDLLELIARARRTSAESRRILMSRAQLMYERERLQYASNRLFRAVVDLSHDFVDQVLPPPEENQSTPARPNSQDEPFRRDDGS